jgi:hypothetical protein
MGDTVRMLAGLAIGAGDRPTGNIIGWHRKAYRLFWTWKSRRARAGRPAVSAAARHLIRTISRDNPLWGAPRICGELLQLGIDVGETSVSKYMARNRKPPSQTWKTFLDNHLKTVVSVDFFTVPTIRFQILYVFLVLAHAAAGSCMWRSLLIRRRNGQPSNCGRLFHGSRPRNMCFADRDRIFGREFKEQPKDMGIREVLGAPRVPQQRAYIERVIGTIRRECLDHLIVFDQASLLRHLKSFLDYYHETRTHLALEKDTLQHRAVQAPAAGRVVAIPQVGGLHHRYERRAA